jgi:hypothetical protein
MATLPKPKASHGVPPTPKRRAFPAVTQTTAETPILIEEIKELPKTTTPRRPIPKRAPTIVKSVVDESAILAKINQRQRQIILHSVLYYKMDISLVLDKTFDKWGRELAKLQADHAELAKTSVFYHDMKDFDGTTGYHLANHGWGLHKAIHIRNVCNNLKEGGVK